MIALMIEDALRDTGFTSFDIVCTDDEAAAAADRRCPDLITTDMHLGSGVWIDRVQNICDEKSIPVVFITATARDVRDRISSCVVLQKPFLSSDLKQAIRQAANATVATHQ